MKKVDRDLLDSREETCSAFVTIISLLARTRSASASALEIGDHHAPSSGRFSP
jgi:hypothetical protein